MVSLEIILTDDSSLMRDLLSAVEAADHDDAVRAVVTTGAGSAYCVGADVTALGNLDPDGKVNLLDRGFQGELGGDWGMPELSPAQKRSDTLGFGRWVTRFLDVGTPTIAAINGGIAGGGLSLALLRDIRIASTTAKFSPAFVALGVSPEMGLSWLLPRIVSVPKAFDLLTRTRPVSAAEALEIGLVEAVVEPGDLHDAALERAARLGELPPVSVRMVKRLLRVRKLGAMIFSGLVGIVHQWAAGLRTDRAMQERARDLVDIAFAAGRPDNTSATWSHRPTPTSDRRNVRG